MAGRVASLCLRGGASTPLLASKPSHAEDASEAPSTETLESTGLRRPHSAFVSLGLLALVAVVLVSSSSSGPSSSEPLAETTTYLRSEAPPAAASSTLEITITNEYTEDHGYPGELYDFFDSSAVIEPFRKTTFAVSLSGAEKGVHLDSCDWGSLTAVDSVTEENAYFGRELSEDEQPSTSASTLAYIAFATMPGPHTLSVSCTLTNGVVKSLTKKITSYYVRRELRDLSDSDRERFLRAMKVTYEVSDVTRGRKLYGTHYFPARYFVNIHLEEASPRNTDHIHDGIGFLEQHTALTQAYELALQTVDPLVTIPYWDYTIDSVHMKKLDNKGEYLFKECELFTDKWFGSVDPVNFHIADGVFKELEVGVAAEDATLKSPYGYMRAPWNLNPSKYITRYHKMCDVTPDTTGLFEWPGCASHFRLTFNDQYDSFYKYSWQAAVKPHGPVHVWIGGMGSDGSCEKMGSRLSSLGLDDTSIEIYKLATFYTMKNLYRASSLNFDHSCDIDDQGSCKFHCVRGTDEEFSTLYSTMVGYLETFGASSTKLSAIDEEDLLNALLCENKFWPGDQLESGSPGDPAFWPIHPTLDRLFQFKAMVKPFKSLQVDSDSEDWEYCQWYNTSDCEGHHGADKTFFKAVYKDSKTGQWVSEYIPNGELLTTLFPSADTYKAPYIYDQFKWEHCEAEGYDFARGTTTHSDAWEPSSTSSAFGSGMRI